MKKIITVILLLLIINTTPTAPAAASPAEDWQDAASRYYSIIYNHIIYNNPNLGSDWADWEARAITAYSLQYGINPLLSAALFTQESNFNMTAYSRTGAIGIAQLQPDTAEALGVDPMDPNGNVEGGIRYLAQQLSNFSYAGDWASSFAIAAYNAGPGAIKKYGGIPPYRETINHVLRVGAIFTQLLNQFNAS